MATIKLNPIITDIRNRMGSNVFSKWKGINYVRGYVPPTDRNTEDQQVVRSTFSRLVEIWKGLGSAAKKSWGVFATGRNLSGYNAFIAENFENMKADLALIISQPMEEEPINGFSAATGSASGSITCSFQAPAGTGKEITLFTQRAAGGNGNGQAAITRHEGNASSSVTISGLEPGAQYHMYAVVTEGPYATAKKVSPSVATDAVAGA
jgi:hypothetical protein